MKMEIIGKMRVLNEFDGVKMFFDEKLPTFFLITGYKNYKTNTIRLQTLPIIYPTRERSNNLTHLS